MNPPSLSPTPNTSDLSSELPPAHIAPTRAPTLVASFRFALAGLYYLLWTQRNAKIHTAVAFAVVLLGLMLGISLIEWLILIVTIALVLGAEGVNTAIEAVVDLASPAYHPLAKTAKDVAAGTVLLMATAAVAIGLLIFGSHLFDIIRQLL